ncbi:MAG: hypothetical protein JWN95_2938 [Frankiales bacterium]|nr:hypothetical protein [Frankiales bacterium]
MTAEDELAALDARLRNGEIRLPQYFQLRAELLTAPAPIPADSAPSHADELFVGPAPVSANPWQAPEPAETVASPALESPAAVEPAAVEPAAESPAAVEPTPDLEPPAAVEAPPEVPAYQALEYIAPPPFQAPRFRADPDERAATGDEPEAVNADIPNAYEPTSRSARAGRHVSDDADQDAAGRELADQDAANQDAANQDAADQDAANQDAADQDAAAQLPTEQLPVVQLPTEEQPTTVLPVASPQAETAPDAPDTAGIQAVTVSSMPPPSAPMPAPVSAPRRVRLLVTASVLVVVALLAGLGIWLLSRQGDGQTGPDFAAAAPIFEIPGYPPQAAATSPMTPAKARATQYISAGEETLFTDCGATQGAVEVVRGPDFQWAVVASVFACRDAGAATRVVTSLSQLPAGATPVPVSIDKVQSFSTDSPSNKNCPFLTYSFFASNKLAVRMSVCSQTQPARQTALDQSLQSAVAKYPPS